MPVPKPPAQRVHRVPIAAGGSALSLTNIESVPRPVALQLGEPRCPCCHEYHSVHVPQGTRPGRWTR